VTPARASHWTSFGGEMRTSSGGMARAAPLVRNAHSSQTKASKASPAIRLQRSPGPTGQIRWCQAIRLASDRRSTATPLGRPVEPEVKMT
jgi:hypothetical protein